MAHAHLHWQYEVCVREGQASVTLATHGVGGCDDLRTGQRMMDCQLTDWKFMHHFISTHRPGLKERAVDCFQCCVGHTTE